MSKWLYIIDSWQHQKPWQWESPIHQFQSKGLIMTIIIKRYGDAFLLHAFLLLLSIYNFFSSKMKVYQVVCSLAGAFMIDHGYAVKWHGMLLCHLNTIIEDEPQFLRWILRRVFLLHKTKPCNTKISPFHKGIKIFIYFFLGNRRAREESSEDMQPPQ